VNPRRYKLMSCGVVETLGILGWTIQTSRYGWSPVVTTDEECPNTPRSSGSPNVLTQKIQSKKSRKKSNRICTAKVQDTSHHTGLINKTIGRVCIVPR
jgi:hypothetical protein